MVPWTVDLLVLGATGYTGKLIVHYLAAHREREFFTFSLAGRSKSKLSQLVSDLSIPDIQTYTIDVTDYESLSDLLSSSRAKGLLSTVGLYMKWGMPMACACARKSVHYVDISGETPFMKDLIMELDYLATKTGAMLIPSCGIDSLPPDALVYLSAMTMKKALKDMDLSTDSDALEDVGLSESHSMFSMKAGVSGGTIASLLFMIETISYRELAELTAPDSLSPIKLQTPRTSKLVYAFPAVPPMQYGCAWPFGPANVAIVHRSHGLFQLQVVKDASREREDDCPVFANNFAYTESIAAPNWFIAFLMGLGFVLSAGSLILFPPLRWLVEWLATPPGQGPSEELLKNGYFKAQNVRISSPLPGRIKPIVIESFIRGDPGYILIAVMSAEVALGLLAKLPTTARSGGVLTPTTALGSGLLKRLAASGRFEFESNVRED